MLRSALSAEGLKQGKKTGLAGLSVLCKWVGCSSHLTLHATPGQSIATLTLNDWSSNDLKIVMTTTSIHSLHHPVGGIQYLLISHPQNLSSSRAEFVSSQ